MSNLLNKSGGSLILLRDVVEYGDKEIVF